jgi:hypothetical protein
MKSCRKGDIVSFETKSGRRRIGLVEKVAPNEYPPLALVRPYDAARQKYTGKQKVPLAKIIKRADGRVREELVAALNAPKLDLKTG